MSQTVSQVGYLTTLEHQDFGILGGYLVVDSLGRPLEFHCTAPVQPSRAQEILYGHTLRPYLLGQQIGGSLINAAKLKPHLVLIDQHDLGTFAHDDKTVNRTNKTILALLCADGETTTTTDIGGHAIEFPFSAHDTSAAVAILDSLSKTIDLAEPFQRIHLAIREAQRIGEDVHSTDDQTVDLSTDSAYAA